MNKELPELPTIVEAKNLNSLEQLREQFNNAKEIMPYKVDFLVLKSKEDNFIAYFHDASKSPTIKETVEWMQKTQNLSFPNNVSILNGIKERYDNVFHKDLDFIVGEVMDKYIEKSEKLSQILQDPKLMKMIMKEVQKLGVVINPEEIKKPIVKLK